MKNSVIHSLCIAFYTLTCSYAQEVSVLFPEDLPVETNKVSTTVSPTTLFNRERKSFDLVLSDLSCKQTFNSSERELQLGLMTNVVHAITQTQNFGDDDLNASISMFKNILLFPVVRSDKTAILYCANAISTIRQTSTNEYASELMAAKEADMEFQKERRQRPGFLSVVSRYRGPNLKKLEEKWNPIFGHNRNCEELRRRTFYSLVSVLQSIAMSMPSVDREDLLCALGQHNGFSDEEHNFMARALTTPIFYPDSKNRNDKKSPAIASVTNTESAVAYLSQFHFATSNSTYRSVTELRELRVAISNLLQSDFILSETNALLSIADHISIGRAISVENKDVDFRNAIKYDRFMEFGDSNRLVRAGIVRYGPTSLACRQIYEFREHYNSLLSEFRINCFREVKRELTRPRWAIYSDEDRRKLLEEFLCRASATEEESRKLN